MMDTITRYYGDSMPTAVEPAIRLPELGTATPSQQAVLQRYFPNHALRRREQWALDNTASDENDIALATALRSGHALKQWRWPKRPVLFFSDAHADADAFVASLIASGGIVEDGLQLRLSEYGKKACFVIGGDCLDKGPSNLALLRKIRQLLDTGAKVKLLAGNHDIRLLVGLRTLVRPRTVLSEHFFLRMGPKVVPLLKEVFDLYLSGNPLPHSIPDEATCRQRLMPRDTWPQEFADAARGKLSDEAIAKEIAGMAKKRDSFEQAYRDAGLDLRQVYATAQRCVDLFFAPGGEFSWFFSKMKLSYRAGSFLFIHAGLDDNVADLLKKKGHRHLNKLFRKQHSDDLFSFYHGAVNNTLRTKYRKTDLPLSKKGVKKVNKLGIHAIMHGHRNQTNGQRLMLRQGLLHIEGDITMDRNSRIKEGLSGLGVGFTLIHPSGKVIGISNDHHATRVLEPASYLTWH